MDFAKAFKTITAGIAFVVVIVSFTMVARAAEGKSDALTTYIQKVLGLTSGYQEPPVQPQEHGKAKRYVGPGGLVGKLTGDDEDAGTSQPDTTTPAVTNSNGVGGTEIVPEPGASSAPNPVGAPKFDASAKMAASAGSISAS